MLDLVAWQPKSSSLSACRVHPVQSSFLTTFTREIFLVLMHEKGQWQRFPANPWFALFLLLNERHRDWAVSGHNQVLLSGKQFSMPAALKNFQAAFAIAQ